MSFGFDRDLIPVQTLEPDPTELLMCPVPAIAVTVEGQEEVVIAIASGEPPTLQNFRAVGCADAVSLSWDDPGLSSHTSTRIVRRTDRFPLHENDGIIVANVPVPTAQFEDTSVSKGTQYFYSVFAENNGIFGCLLDTVVSDSATPIHPLEQITDFLGAQCSVYQEFIDAVPGLREAQEDTISTLEALVGFEPVAELLSAAIQARDDVSVPSASTTERTNKVLVDTYRTVVAEVDFYFGNGLLSFAAANGLMLAPEFRKLMDLVFPVYKVLNPEAGLDEDFFVATTVLGLLKEAPAGEVSGYFQFNNGQFDAGVPDQDLFLEANTDIGPVDKTIRLVLFQRDGGDPFTPIIKLVNVSANTAKGTQVAVDPPNRYAVCTRMSFEPPPGNIGDEWLIKANRLRELPS